MAGEQLGRLLHGKGTVAILRYIECCASTGQREAGCLEAIQEISRHSGYSRQSLFRHDHQGGTIDSVGDAGQTPKLVECRLTERVTSMPLTTLATRPVIAFAGGAERIPAILAALRGHWILGLVTDQITAKTLLSL